jgi:hypothetical protein
VVRSSTPTTTPTGSASTPSASTSGSAEALILPD